MARHKDVDWNLHEHNPVGWESVNAALLMDIRDELKELNSHLRCYRIQRMFATLERIDRRLDKKLPLKG